MRRILAAAAGAAAGAAAAFALRGKTGPGPLETLAGTWSGVAAGPGGRRVEVALAVARRPRRGLLGAAGYEVAMRTLEDLGGKPLERSTSGEDLTPPARGTAGSVLVVTSRTLRVELDADKGEVRLLAARYWRAPALDLDVVLVRSEGASPELLLQVDPEPESEATP